MSGPGLSWRVIVSIRRAYGAGAIHWQHPLPGGAIAATAIVASIGSWLADWRLVGVLVVFVWPFAARADPSPGRVLFLLLMIGELAAWRAGVVWDGLVPRHLGPYEGWARLIDDPKPFDSATRVLFEIDGERFELWARGRAIRLRVAEWRAGEYVRVHGDRMALKPARLDRVAWQHIVGEFRLEWVSDVATGGPLDRASNRVRAAIERGAAELPADDEALFRGLVVGDDRDQPSTMIDRFRASGLSHLTAVSGQNVGFVLAAAGPLLKRLRPWVRWAATVGLVAWFVSLTRFEPSIVRAGTMAGISATAFVLGRERAPARLLAIAVVGLLLIDPLLVRSVGFWLSVGATAGVSTIGPWLADRLRRLGLLAIPLGITLGAQVGVAIPSVLVFGRLPLVSIPANLLAIPVAGFVMLYGLPAGLVAGAVPSLAPVVMFPCRIGVRWVDTIAVLGERIEPGGTTTWVGWSLLVAAVGLIAAMNRDRHERASADR